MKDRAVNQIGVVGLGTMGRALALNFVSKGFKVAGFNRTYKVTQNIISENQAGFSGYEFIEEFVNSLEIPRKIILMLPAGQAVESFILKILPLLSNEDILMDGGNSHFSDTNRRYTLLSEKGIYYFGVGISGGESGALHGPSIMPGGNKEAYPKIKDYLEAVSAKKDGDPCCAYIGRAGAGHFVKMVHNGIEYADMQLIAELYLLMGSYLKLSNAEMAQVFKEYNNSDLQSYPIEITEKILREKDSDQSDIIDAIADKVSQKGTGQWTILEAAERQSIISVIGAAVQARVMSSNTTEREQFKKINTSPVNSSIEIDVKKLQNAYKIAKYVAYAQGFNLMGSSSNEYEFSLNLREIASIFRAGCIIQAKLLDKLMDLFEDKNLTNFLLHPAIKSEIEENLNDLRSVNAAATLAGIPIPAFSAALLYIEQLISPKLGANLLAAQRDFFGAHTFERKDSEGAFHHEWED